MSALVTYSDTAPRFHDTRKISLDKILQAINGGAGGNPAFVGVKMKEQTGSAVTSFEINFTPSAAGNMILIVLCCSTSDITWGLNSAQGTWQQDAYKAGGFVDLTLSIWSSGGVAGGAHTVTVTVSALEFVRYAVLEFSGVANSNRVIDASTNAGITIGITSGDVTTGSDNTLLFAAVRTDGDDSVHGDIGAGAGFLLCYPFANSEPEQKMMCEYRVVDAGTHPNGFTLEFVDGGGWVAGLVAYGPA